MDTHQTELNDLIQSSVVSTSFQQEADKQENILRPKMLKDFQGQQRLKDNLAVFIQAALERKEPLDHTFLIGPPGLGENNIGKHHCQ